LAHKITLFTSALIKLNYKCAVQQRTFFKQHFHMHMLSTSSSSEDIFNSGINHLSSSQPHINYCLIFITIDVSQISVDFDHMNRPS
jgi:hypothetical protein